VYNACGPYGPLYENATAGDDVSPPTLLVPERVGSPRWSPDGRRIAYTSWVGTITGAGIFVGTGTIETVAADGGGRRTLAQGSDADWSPDGTQLAFSGDGGTIRVVDSDGAMVHTVATGIEPSWSPDGSRIAFLAPEPGPGAQLETVAPDGSDLRVLAGAAFSTRPEWSPDGHRLAFFAGVGLAVVDAAGGGERVLVPNAEPGFVAWSADGSRLLAGNGLVVDVRSGSIRRPFPQETVLAASAAWERLVLAVPPTGAYEPPDLYVVDRQGRNPKQVSERRCAGANRLCGSDGVDVLRAAHGWILGGAGGDRLSGGSGPNHLEGSFGDDVLIGGGGEDYLWGQAGNDRLVGSGRFSLLDGGPGADRIDDARGYSNRILGGPGPDVVIAGRSDVVRVDDDATHDVVRCAGPGDYVYLGQRDTVRPGCAHVYRARR
jgi:dipeptidyl aminopeptidase/acylaminoacyl peptidase